MIARKQLKNKTIKKVTLSRNMATIFFTDGSLTSIAHDGDQLNMCYQPKGQSVDFITPGLEEEGEPDAVLR